MSGERFEAPEILFQPALVGIEQAGVSEAVFQCIQQADVDLRAQLYAHVVLSGGTTTMPGFSERLERDLCRMYTDRINSHKQVSFQYSCAVASHQGHLSR